MKSHGIVNYFKALHLNCTLKDYSRNYLLKRWLREVTLPCSLESYALGPTEARQRPSPLVTQEGPIIIVAKTPRFQPVYVSSLWYPLAAERTGRWV